MRLASAACLRAATRSPAPIATKPREIASYARSPRRRCKCRRKMKGDRSRALGEVHKSISAATATSKPAASTITEVSMCMPCQVTTTSPGRSASHAAPSASRPTRMRKMTTRIIANSGLANAASAAAATCRLSVSAARRAPAFLAHASVNARASSGNLAISASAASMSPRAASASGRAIRAAGSSPAGAADVPTGVMRTSFCAGFQASPRSSCCSAQAPSPERVQA